MRYTMLFLCPHNAAKSVLAAAYCQHLAAQCGLEVRVTSAGTEPDAAASPEVVALLRAEGLDVAHHRPRHVTREEWGRLSASSRWGAMSDTSPHLAHWWSTGMTCLRPVNIWHVPVMSSTPMWSNS